ncbi:MAG: hypothetical protein GIX03_10280 [Candidatus Eremiobacteraeota bacterium]|nr:hypothetical protein [Candidatus Eremiobacteraeota bacterium]MBC5803358.1 hypothetical protein [Candidatus Eremiobacteraeota bacterium]MBC5822148.1 hypothetical protein [Candidatus Eremiobacteraeota bacterium]
MNQHLTNDTLIDYLHGELRPQDDALAHAHLAVCSSCRQARDAESGVTDFLRAGAAAEEQEFPSLVAAAVWQRIREAPPTPLARFRTFFRPAIAVPLAAVLLVGGWFASPLGHGSSGGARSIDALYYFQAHAAQSASSPLSEHSGMPVDETSMNDEAGSAAPLVDQYAAYALSGGINAVR